MALSLNIQWKNHDITMVFSEVISMEYKYGNQTVPLHILKVSYSKKKPIGKTLKQGFINKQ